MADLHKHSSNCVDKGVELQPGLRSILLLGLLASGGLLNASTASAQTPVVLEAGRPQATAAARVQQRQQQLRQIQPESYDLTRFPVIDRNERHWRNLLWTTAIAEPQAPYVDQALSRILTLTTRPGLSQSQSRTVEMAMQVGTQLYLSNPTVYTGVKQQFFQTIHRSRDPQWVAMALSGLIKQGVSADELKQLRDRVKVRFPKWSQHPSLYTTLQEVSVALAPQPVPPLKDLLQRNIAPGQPHLYVICQPDRGVLCQAVLKDRRGQFVRENGQLWSVSLLSRSIHGLGWNFVRGQTPQGIYRIEGAMPKSEEQFFRAYGQFPLVKMFMPFESGVREFLPGQKGSFKSSLSAYQALLPPSWRHYLPMQQSFWAGKIGRSLFRIHGSGEAPEFFSSNQRYPVSNGWNPTIGCLSALELYDEAGRLQRADMPKILNALTTVGGKNFSGYLVLVEIPGTSKIPIPVTELEAAVR